MAFQPFTQLPSNTSSSGGFQPFTQGNQVSNNPGYTQPKKLAPIQTVQAPSKGFQIGDVINFAKGIGTNAINEVKNDITKLSNGLQLSFTQSTKKSTEPSFSVNQQKQQIPTISNFNSQQKQLTLDQMQEVKPSSATMKVTPQSLVSQKKFLADPKTFVAEHPATINTIKKIGKDFVNSYADSNSDDPFVFGTDTGDSTPVSKKDWAKMDTKQKLGAISMSLLNGSTLGAGQEVAGTVKGFSKLGAAIGAALGVSTNAVIKYLSDPKHSIKDAILNPENLVYGILGGSLGGISVHEGLPPGEHTPQEVIDHVVQNDLSKTKDGELMMKAALEAKRKNQNIEVAKSNPVIDTFEQNKKDYQSFGGKSVGTESPNAALRDIQTASENPEVQAHTKSQVQKAIDTGEVPVNKDGTITLYRGGVPSKVNGLMSATYDKSIAEKFGNVTEIKVKPDDIQAFIGKDEKEVLLKNETQKPNVAEQSIGDLKTTGKRVLNTKEVNAVKSVIDSKLKDISKNSSSYKDAEKKYTDLYDEVVNKSNNDKVVLSALRTKLNEEMYGYSGKTGNYKKDFAVLQELRKQDPELGSMVDTLDSLISKLDEKLLTAQEPQRVTPITEKTSRKPQSQEVVASKSETYKVSKIAKEIEAKAVEKKLTDGFSDLAGYDPSTVKEQARVNTDIINQGEDHFRSIIRGEQPLPKEANPAYFIKTVETYLDQHPNPEILQELAKSPLISETSRAAQTLRFSAERDPYSPISIIQKLHDDSKAVIQKARDSIQKVVKKQTKIPDKHDWSSFLDSIQC